ncbi:hypothetical protein GCM10023346_48940 [Arthrobacter gyeryongensis]|uniref:Uncharacterized protein n=1 Tax=Arthrobacter gyeryongensis TaxID=1650592 RepID=A0ABP8VAV2_9MICC
MHSPVPWPPIGSRGRRLPCARRQRLRVLAKVQLRAAGPHPAEQQRERLEQRRRIGRQQDAAELVTE